MTTTDNEGGNKATRFPREQYALLRRQMRELYQRGGDNWMQAPQKAQHQQVRVLGGHFEDGSRGVPMGYLFGTVAEREAAQSVLRGERT